MQQSFDANCDIWGTVFSVETIILQSRIRFSGARAFLKPLAKMPRIRLETKMNKFLIGAVGLVAMATSASAADLGRPYTKAPPPMMVAMYDWSGFYIGLNGGGGSSHKCWDEVNDGSGPIPLAAEGCHDATGGTVGGQIGYRWQASSWVFGLEAQGNWADFSGSNASLLNLGAANRSKIDAFGLFTGQVGYAINNVLLYVKGGAAVTNDKYDSYDILTGLDFATASETRWGGVIGVGVEYSFTPNWSVGFEYDHMFMGTRDVNGYATANSNFAPGTFAGTERISQDVDLATVRVNYRWGGPVIAKY
jgi:outer membrane immunogenic protein